VNPVGMISGFLDDPGPASGCDLECVVVFFPSPLPSETHEAQSTCKNRRAGRCSGVLPTSRSDRRQPGRFLAHHPDGTRPVASEVRKVQLG